VTSKNAWLVVKISRLRFWLVAVVFIALALGIAVFVPLNVGVTHVRTEIDIDRAPHDVYEYVSTPSNWPRWHPSSIAVKGNANHSLALGESVVEEFNVAGRHGFATWRVVARDADRLWQIEGEIDGHPAGVVTYMLTKSGTGTHFVRLFDYRSRTILFAIVNALGLRDRITAESEKALAQLRVLLESKQRVAAGDACAAPLTTAFAAALRSTRTPGLILLA
jgi:uncharacterized protein YndB with AHSA1/START domain